MSDVSLMFSGGVDSTYVALRLLDDHPRIHLLTYSNGYGVSGLRHARRRAAELNARHRGRFTHEVVSIRPLFEAMVLRSLSEDYQTYRSGFIWCLGCKLAMHAMSAAYARSHGIRRHTDGSSGDTSEMVEQMEVSIRAIQRFYQDHGLGYEAVDYSVTRAVKKAALVAQGFRMGIPLLDRHLGIQPRCIPGELYYLPFVLLGQAPTHPEEMVEAFIQAKRPLMDQMVREYTTHAR